MNRFIQNYLEKSVSPSHLEWFRRLFCAALAIQVSLNAKYFSVAIRHKPFYNPLTLLKPFALNRPDPVVFDGVMYTLIFLLAIGVTGFLSRVVLPLSLALCFWVLGVQHGLDKAAGNDYVFHSKNIVIFILLILSVAQRGTGKIWPLTLIRLSLALAYFGSAFTKAIHAGWRWMDGYTLQKYLYQHAYILDLPDTLWLAQHHKLCVALSVGIMAFEFGFVFFVLHPFYSLIFAAGGILFHLSTLHFMKIDFLPYHGFAYLIFVVGGFGLKEYLNQLRRSVTATEPEPGPDTAAATAIY